MKPWRVTQSTALIERHWLTVREERIELPHGGEIEEFHLIESPDWVGVLALTEDGQVILVDQYRHGARRVSRELPAGVIEPGETPLAAAIRELREETGYVAEDWQHLVTVNTEPTRHTNHAHFFFASRARRVGEPCFDPTEQIEVRLTPPAALLQAIDSGQILHGVHLGPVLLAARRGLLPPG